MYFHTGRRILLFFFFRLALTACLFFLLVAHYFVSFLESRHLKLVLFVLLLNNDEFTMLTSEKVR